MVDLAGGMDVRTCRGADLPPMLPALAALRVRVFRDWPYLYAGDEAYEAEYLRVYADSPSAAIIVASDGENIVGASTCLRLAEEGDAVRAPFHACGLDPARFFYFGESVLLPAYRGRGLGVAFFAAREAHARAVSDCDFACFCAVVRPDDHPMRPADFTPLDDFWRRRGFVRRPDLICRMAWTDVGQAAQTPKDLVFWMKSLTGAALP